MSYPDDPKIGPDGEVAPGGCADEGALYDPHVLRQELRELREELAEVRRQRVLVVAEAEGLGSQLLDVQQDCVRAVRERDQARQERDVVVAEVEGLGRTIAKMRAVALALGGPVEAQADRVERARVLERVQDDLEAERDRLAGCGVVALGGTSAPVRARRGDYGWSPSYEDVLCLRLKYERILRAAGQAAGAERGWTSAPWTDVLREVAELDRRRAADEELGS
jgi:hypothetical protein